MTNENRPTLRLTLFGTMRATLNDISLAGKSAKKEMWLLALLALRADKAASREYLSALLWPDAMEEQALYNLRRSLSNLRSTLGAANDCVEIIKPRSLLFNSTKASVDVHAFDSLVVSNKPEDLELAISLHCAPLLEDCLEDWIFPERSFRQTNYGKALDGMANAAMERESWTDAARYARLMIAADPLEEKASRTLMTALAKDGGHGAAMQAYRDLRLRLREEINAEPDLQTVSLYDSLRSNARQQASLRAISPAEVGAVLQNSKNAADPAAKKLTSPSWCLPQPLTRLIGRELEQDEILSYLRTARLVTLAGAGGIGKTRLSIEVARRAVSSFEDGVLFVELAALGDPDRLPLLIAQNLKITENPNISALDSLYFRLSQSEVLLVLDNCEHLLDACAKLAHALLTHCPKLRILATSRQSLGITGEIVWRVSPLPAPPETPYQLTLDPTKTDSSGPLEYPSVQLFVERVLQTAPHFRLTPQSLATIAHICRQLDGIPLALELAAGRVRVLPLERISARLQDRLNLLVGGNRASLPRQQTLRALIDWSHDLLTETERTLFRRLAIFSGGWTLEAAEAVLCDEIALKAERSDEPKTSDSGLSFPNATIEKWEALDLLMALVEKSLVVYEEKECGSRYRMLETVRQYAEEKLEQSGETESVKKRYIDFFYRYVLELKETMYGPRQAHALNRFEEDRDNLSKVIDFATFSEDSLEKSMEIAGVLQVYWRVRGYLTEGRAALQKLLEISTNPTVSRGAVLNATCTLAYIQGDYLKARNYGEEGLSILRTLGNSPGIAAALGNLANVANYMGDCDEARRLNEEALALYIQLQNRRSIAITLNGLGGVMMKLGEIDEAEKRFREGLSIRREMGDSLGIAITLSNLCDIADTRCDYESLEKMLHESDEIYQSLSDARGVAIVQESKGRLAQKRKDYISALNYYREALALFRKIGDQRGYVSFLELTMHLAMEQEEYDRAVRLYGALETFRLAIRYVAPQASNQKTLEMMRMLEEKMNSGIFSDLFTEGESFTIEEALKYANER